MLQSIAEPLAGGNEVGVGEVVQPGDVPPAIGPEDAAERFAALDDMHAATRGRESTDGGYHASVGDDAARIDQADVAGRHAPRGDGPQSRSCGDAADGVAGTHPHGN